MISVGDLHWMSIDFGENLPLGGKLRTALSEADKVERNQCVVLHMAAAYEWVPQGRPRMPSAMSRVHAIGTQLRQAEFQQAADSMAAARPPISLRDHEVASAAHDVLSGHHDRGFEDMDLFFSASFKDPMMPLVAIELNLAAHPPRSRALALSDSMDFPIDRAMVLGVWNGHT